MTRLWLLIAAVVLMLTPSADAEFRWRRVVRIPAPAPMPYRCGPGGCYPVPTYPTQPPSTWCGPSGCFTGPGTLKERYRGPALPPQSLPRGPTSSAPEFVPPTADIP